MNYPVVTLANPNTLQPVTLQYDPGYSSTYDEPGEPASWWCYEGTSVTDDQWNQLEQQAFELSADYFEWESR